MVLLLKLCYNVCLALITVLFLSVLYVTTVALKRKQLSRKLPGMQVALFDILGDLKKFRMSLRPGSSMCINIYTLQTLSGYTQLFRNKMLFCFWMMFIPVVWIVKAEAVEQLISGTKNLEKSWFYAWLRPWINTGLITSHGQKWKSRRKLLMHYFHFDIWEDFLPTMHEKSQILVHILKNETQKDWTDISKLISLCSLDIISEATLGISFNIQENTKSTYVEALTRVSTVIRRRMSHPLYLFDCLFYMSDAGRQFKEDVKLIHNFITSVIHHKKEKLQGRRSSVLRRYSESSVPRRYSESSVPRRHSGSSVPRNQKALMDVLLEHHLQEEDLTEEDIREEVDTFTFGGHDTISMGVTWALYLIGLYQDVQDRIHEELNLIFGDDHERSITTDDLKNMEYLDRVLKESQRLYPSVPMFSRRSDSGNVINGYNIPEGTAVVVFTYELHRDPEMFPNPEKFDPDRFLPENSVNRHPYAYIPFSAGPRNCIGQKFAETEEKVIVANILRNYSLESLVPRDKVIPVAEMILRNAEPLKFRIRHTKS